MQLGQLLDQQEIAIYFMEELNRDCLELADANTEFSRLAYPDLINESLIPWMTNPSNDLDSATGLILLTRIAFILTFEFRRSFQEVIGHVKRETLSAADNDRVSHASENRPAVGTSEWGLAVCVPPARRFLDFLLSIDALNISAMIINAKSDFESKKREILQSIRSPKPVYLTVKAAASMTGVSEATIRRREEDGTLLGDRSNGSLSIERTSLQNYMKSSKFPNRKQ